VPLKQKEPMQAKPFLYANAFEDTGILQCCFGASSDVEEAVIGHGKVEGPFTEIDGLEIEPDDSYPTRVTVQFYNATSNGVVSEQDMRDIADQINKVCQQADYVGSLVVEGPRGRPTLGAENLRGCRLRGNYREGEYENCNSPTRQKIAPASGHPPTS
jgi:hypothetical protein